jgi:hypothetical protein
LPEEHVSQFEELVSQFGEMPLDDAVVGPVGDTIGDILRLGHDPDWIVLVEPGGSVAGVASRAELLSQPPDALARAALTTPQVVVVAHAESSVVTGMATWAFEEARRDPQDVVVVVRDGSTVRGVWHGPDLVEALEIGATRSGMDTTLPGDVHIPELLRYCGYILDDVACRAALSFREFPSMMPQCPNPLQLTGHAFEW